MLSWTWEVKLTVNLAEYSNAWSLDDNLKYLSQHLQSTNGKSQSADRGENCSQSLNGTKPDKSFFSRLMCSNYDNWVKIIRIKK